MIVLEARDRVGGRVHTLTGQGFTTGVDMGASIITGTATNAERGLRCDPSAVLARSVTRPSCLQLQVIHTNHLEGLPIGL